MITAVFIWIRIKINGSSSCIQLMDGFNIEQEQIDFKTLVHNTIGI